MLDDEINPLEFSHKQIYKHTNLTDGSSVEVYDAASVPVTFYIRCDRPGVAAVTVPVPEDFFAHTFNSIHLGHTGE